MTCYYFLVIYYFCFLFNNFICQTTDDCGTKYSCFTYPEDCKNSNCKLIYKWQESKDKENIKFSLAAKVSDLIPIEASWLAIGFSTDQFMGNDQVVICKNLGADSTIQHYLTLGGKVSPIPFNDPSIGLTSLKVTTTDKGFLMCSFNREISSSKFESVEPNYIDLNNKAYYLIASFGSIPGSSLNEINKHVLTATSSDPISFTNHPGQVIAVKNALKVKSHAGLMLIAWLFLAPLGITIARYYKFIFPNKKIMGLKVWFFLHRPIMCLVLILTLISFLIILSDKNWTWINIRSLHSFIHSIFGITVIGLVFLQIIVALCRPHPDSPNRIAFNYKHAITALLIFIASITTIFTGITLPRMNLDMKPTGLMIGWILSVLLFIIVIELIQRKFYKDIFHFNISNNLSISSDRLENKAQVKLDIFKIIFIAYILMALIGFTVALIYYVAEAKIN